MGKQLYDSLPLVKQALDTLAGALDKHLDQPLLSILFAEDKSSEAALLNQTAYTQPALFAFEVAMATLWQFWGG